VLYIYLVIKYLIVLLIITNSKVVIYDILLLQLVRSLVRDYSKYKI